MRSLLLKSIIALILSACCYEMCNAQVIKVKKKEYKKAAKKKIRGLKRKAFTPKGSGSIKLYVINALNKEFEVDEENNKLHSVVYTSMVDPTFEGAVSACRAASRVTIAGNIETNVAELVKRSLNSDQVSAKSANGINQTVIAGKQLIAQRVSIDDIYVLYREVKDEIDGHTLIEVEYACFYNKDKALEKAIEHIRQEMKEETEELHKDLDKIFLQN